MRGARGLFVVTLVAVLAATPLTRPDAVAQARQSYEPTEARQTDETAGLRQSDRAAGDRDEGGEPEESALALARRTKQPVEVTALRSETRQVFAEPDGTLVLERV